MSNPSSPGRASTCPLIRRRVPARSAPTAVACRRWSRPAASRHRRSGRAARRFHSDRTHSTRRRATGRSVRLPRSTHQRVSARSGRDRCSPSSGKRKRSIPGRVPTLDGGVSARKMSAVPSGVTVDGNCATVPCINCSAVPVPSDGRRNRLRGALGPPSLLDA